MRTVTHFVHAGFVWACLAFGTWAVNAEAQGQDDHVQRWDVFEVVVEGPDDDDAYREVSFAAVFRSHEQRRQMTVPGFYDDNGKYMIRFSPPSLGRWTFKTTSNRTDLADKTGSFTCIPPASNNHGPVQVANTFYLRYADGTPYYGVGTTAYQWTSVDPGVQQKTLETLATAPFNKVRMCFFPKFYDYGNKSEPWAYPFRRVDDQNDLTKPNYAFFRNFDRRVRQLRDMGIQADVILFHSYDKWGYAAMGPDNDDRYLRYLIARLSAYRNVWWSMANEYDLMIHNQEKTLSDFDRFLQIFQSEDPHQRLRGIHNWYGTEDHFYDHSQPWVTHASLQTSQFFNALRWRAQYKKPLLFDEMRYEGDVQSGWGNMSSEEMTSYFWMAGLSGGYGTHGETFDNRADGSETRWWGKGGTLVGKSSSRIAFFRKVMQEAPVTQMTPTLISAGKPETMSDNVYIFAKPGSYYLAYAAKSGTTIQLDLPSGTLYDIDLMDTWNMTTRQLPAAESGKFSLTTDGDYRVLRVVARSAE